MKGGKCCTKMSAAFDFIFSCKRSNMWVHQVSGQDGWILAKFFLGVFLDRDGFEFYKFAKNERDKNIQQT